MYKTWASPEDAPLPTAAPFRVAVGGILPGYAGHVPHAQLHIGAAHTGGVRRSAPRDANIHLRLAEAHTIARHKFNDDCHSLPLPNASNGYYVNSPQRPDISKLDALWAPNYSGSRGPQSDAIGRLHRTTYHRGPGRRAAEERAVHACVGAFHDESTPYSEVHPGHAARRPASARDRRLEDRGHNLQEEATRIATVSQQIKAGRNVQNTVAATNDWLMHSATPPPPLPAGASAYRAQVGGIVPGYAGHVPQSREHSASSHVGGVHAVAVKGTVGAARARGQVYVNGGLLHAREPRPGDGTGKRGRHGWRSRCTLSCWLRRPSPGQQHAHMGRFILAWGRAGCRGCSRGKYSTCVTCGCTVSCTARCYSPRARGRAGSARGSRLAGSARAG